ncbi:MAG: hypothetical protein ACFCVE_09120 [Phycisphaerae bacterium]
MATATDPIKTYDARWEEADFTDAQVRRLVEATLLYAQTLGVDTLTLTRDARLGCGRVMEIALDVALPAGFRVYTQLQPVSTPQSYFTTQWVTREHPRTMGLAVTASHNPAPYVGIKFTVPPVSAIGFDCGPAGGLRKVREIYHSPQKLANKAGGRLHVVNLVSEYVQYSMRTAGLAAGDLDGVGVVLDAFNGSAGPELHLAYEMAGCRVLSRRLVPDGRFPTGSPNPTSQGKMQEATDLAKANDCQAVLGIDGDGDRIVFGDGRGILTAGFAFVPILESVLQSGDVEPGVPVLYDPKVSPLALAEWGRLGAKPVLFRNGHSQIKDYMTQVGALAAAEESGHYYHRLTLGDVTVSSENSALTTLLFLKALKAHPGMMDELWARENQIFTTGEFNYQFADDATRDAALAAVVKHFADAGAQTRTETHDGIDLEGTCLNRGVHLEPGNVKLDDGWLSGYLRVATNEKGVVRSYFTAGDAGYGQEIEAEARRIQQKQFGGQVVE